MWSLILMSLAGALNASYEILFTGFKESVFRNLDPSYWDLTKCWVRKWSMPLEESKRKWYYLGYKPRYKEKYPYSSTVLVFLTDPFHLLKALMLVCIMTSLVSYSKLISPFVDWFIYLVVFDLTFSLFFDYILRVSKVKKPKP